MHALSVGLLRAKQLPVITNGLGASPHAGSTCTIGVVTVRPLNRLPARLYFKLKPDPNNTFFFIFTCTTQYPWVLANLNLSQAIAPSKKKRTHTVFRDSSAHRSASTSKPRFVGEKVRLGDCFPYIKNGYNVRQGKDKGGMPITRIETLSDNRFNRDKVGYADIFSTEGLENHILEDGDILMSHINSLPYLGRSVMYRARPGEVFIHGMNLLRLKADRSVVEPGYAELYFRSPRFKQHVLKIAKKAVNQASFSVSDLKEIEFPLMSLCDQHDVIEKLSSVTAQIEHCQRAIGKLDSLVKSRFVEMFGDPALNPMKWDIGTIESYCDNLDSRRVPIAQGNRVDGPYPYIGASGVVDHVANYLFDETLLLISEDGANLLARTSPIAFTVSGKAWVNNHAHMLRCRDDETRVYLQTLINMLDISLYVSGSAQPKLSQKQMNRIPIMLPSRKLLVEFAAFAVRVDKSRFVRDHEMNFR